MSHENDNPNEPDMNDFSEIYQSTRSDEPSAALDAAILARAEEAVAPKRKRPAWIAPVGLAATVLLGVNLAVNLKDYSSDPDVFMETSRPIAQSADKPERMASARSDEAADTDRGNKRIAASLDSYNLESRIQELRADEGDSVAPQPAPAPLPRIAYATDALEDTGTLAREAPAASPKDLSEYARRAVAGNETRRAIESGQKRAALPTEASNVPRKELSAQIAGKKEIKRAHEPKASAREPSPPSTIESAAPVAETSTGSTFPNSAPTGSAPQPVDATPAPVVSTTPENEPITDHLLMAAPRVPRQPQQQEQEQESDDIGLEEIVVTGSSISETDDSPHRRLTAKDQVIRNARQLTNSALGVSGDDADRDEGTAASANPVQSAPVYICDLSALKIDTNAIETAKVNARTSEPPLNALTWPTHIRELSSEGDYVSACTHLAAYQQLFPGVAMIELLPVTIPTKNQITDTRH